MIHQKKLENFSEATKKGGEWEFEEVSQSTVLKLFSTVIEKCGE